jgi:hypothetical protein
MEEINICELCRLKYEPKEVSGVWRLQEFQGYTVDLRLQQFRKVEVGKPLQFIEFASPQGKQLLQRMHEEATK